jgi:hypothetical protein
MLIIHNIWKIYSLKTLTFLPKYVGFEKTYFQNTWIILLYALLLKKDILKTAFKFTQETFFSNFYKLEILSILTLIVAIFNNLLLCKLW